MTIDWQAVAKERAATIGEERARAVAAEKELAELREAAMAFFKSDGSLGGRLAEDRVRRALAEAAS